MAASIDNRVAELERANAQLRRQLDACSAELNEARDQQTATAEVLQVINSSSGDLAPVFDAMLEKAMRLCDAAFGSLLINDGERLRVAALNSVPEPLAKFLSEPLVPEPGTALARVIDERRLVHWADAAAEEGYLQRAPLAVAGVELGGVRTLVGVPLFRDRTLLGVLHLYRQEVRPFTDKQIALLQNFAAQAVIAMENARLITETREALEQQTATAEVLQVINASPGDLAPVFDAILEKAHTLCGAASGGLVEIEGEQYRAVAVHGEPRFAEYWMQQGWIHATTGALAQLRQGEPLHIPNVTVDDGRRYSEQYKRLIELSNARSLLMVPMRKDDALLGAITALRQEVRPFAEREIALLQNFAAQAVIAMENARLITETREALEQQTATAEVLQVINSSPGDLAPVFDAMLEKATELCDAPVGTLWLFDGEHINPVATRGAPERLADFLHRGPHKPNPVQQRQLRGEGTIHLADLKATTLYRGGDTLARAVADLGGIQTVLSVPLRREDRVLGLFGVYRQETRPFSDKQIALIDNFAAQAVIAMENARLLTETREALEQQTATAEVLQVINSSPGDLAPVFDAMLEKAMRLCEAALGVLWTYDGDAFHVAASRGAPPAYAEFLASAVHQPGPNTAHGRLLSGSPFEHLPDVASSEDYRLGDAFPRALVDLAGGRTILAVPLRKDEVFLGDIFIYRQEVRPFTDKQIALLQNFAVQAVIAIENTRLITETREALEQQTATAEVLGVINSSPGDLAPVFDAMLEKAVRLCEATFGGLTRVDGDRFHAVAMHNVPQVFAEAMRQPRPMLPGHAHHRLLNGEDVVQVEDVTAEDIYRSGDPSRHALADLGGARTVLWAALRKDNTLLGSFVIYRQEVRPFTDKQIALLQNFAAQAVIAIENARLLTETREALEQQTATAEVLQVINSSPGDLAPVFDAMLEKALHLCGAPYGILWNYDGEAFEIAAQRGVPKAFLDTMSGPQRPTSPETTRGRLVAGEHVVHITNLGADLLYQSGDLHRRALVDAAGAQVVVAVSLRKDDKLLGAFTIYRQEARPFTDKQIALVTTFADQAVIAVENARLLTETREALEQQTATAEVLQIINSSPGDLAPVFDAMLDKALNLCGAAFGILQTIDGKSFQTVAHRGVSPAFADFLAAPREVSATGLIAEFLEGARFVHRDAAAGEGYRSAVPVARALVELEGARTLLSVPLRKDATLVGWIVIYRREVRPFTDKQIALLQNFAAQAVIAMENARLITETREALEQQTATAEVLQVINSSPGDLAPVFDAMIRKAVRLCGAVQGSLRTFDGEALHLAAWHGDPSFAERARELGPIVPRQGHPMEPLLRGQRIVHLTDAREATANSEDSAVRERVAAGNIRSWLAVALRTDGGLLGSIAVSRHEVRPFTDKQIALLQNFAAQAVIAMENARLLTETREALEQQTATAEVLQVINSSPGDLAPVFDAMLEKATRLCEAPFGILRTWDGERLHFGAVHGDPQFSDWVRQRGPIRPDSDRSPMGRILAGERVVSVADAPGDEGYRTSAGWREMVEASGVRSAIWVGLHKDDALLGYITVYRQEVRPFSDKQIALLQNFAAQAVIAMENARLLTETREALEQQTATAEVLGVINSSPGDLTAVFDAILEKAHSLCGAEIGSLQLYDGETLHAVATHAVPEEFADILRQGYRAADSPASRGLIEGERFIQISDCAEIDHPVVRSAAQLVGIRTLLVVPLRRDDAFLGLISAARLEVRPFTDKQIALLQNFAAQAVIAMENARLLTETREALEQQTATAEVLQVINSSPGDLAPVFDAILEKAHSFCGAVHGSLHIADADGFRGVAMRGVPEAFADFIKHPFQPGPNHPVRELIGGAPFATVINSPEFDDPIIQSAYKLAGMRTGLFVPLRKDRALRGYIVAARPEVRPFSDKQIALLQNFAAQAVIAMENARLLTETREALEQQTATAEVLQVINASPGDLAPVFDAMLERALRLCEASFGVLCTYDETSFRAVALRGVPAAYAEFLTAGPLRPGPGNGLTRVAAGEKVVHVVDLAAEDVYRSGETLRRALVDLGGARSALTVALLKDELLLGAFIIYRGEVRAFTDKQIALLQNFAAQAVIAMENARLLTETREALEQQTATAEVLQVINSSPGDLAPVFDAMLEKAVRLCEGPFGTLRTWDGERFHFGAVYGDPKLSDWVRRRGSFHPDGGSSPLRRIIEGQQVVQVADASSDPGSSTSPAFREMVEASGMRSVITVALRKDEALLGTIQVYRQEVRPFTDKQIALLQNFAAQAVIAMENARLLTETREALEQQTATAEVLQVINSSPGDLKPVFDAMLEKAMHLCGAAFGTLWTYDEDRFRPMAYRGVPARYAEFLEHNAPLASAGTGRARILAGERVIHVSDLADEEPYRAGDLHRRALVDLGGARTGLIVPLLKHAEVLGYIRIYRQEVRPFSVKQIALLQNFAAQAVIAMENARLLTETREALEQQTATAEVLQVINSSPGDLAPVFDAMLEKATRLSETAFGAMFTYDGERFHITAAHGPPALVRSLKEFGPISAEPGTMLVRHLGGELVVQRADIASDQPTDAGPLVRRAFVDLGGARSSVSVALQKDRKLLGVIQAYRQEVRPFTDKQIALLQNFAAQAVIAMENARLLTETRQALEQQTATAEVLQVINSSPGELAPVFDAMLDKAMRLCEAAFGTLWTYDGACVHAAALHNVPPEFAEFLTRAPHQVGPDSAHGRLLRGEPVVHIPDIVAEKAYGLGDPIRRALVELGGGRTLLAVPLRKDSTFLGDFVIYRQESRPFSDKQIALLQNFAAQAVIAMENARLITETREALEQQTATAEVLQVINSSPGDLAPVFDAILEKAHILCGAASGGLVEIEGEQYRAVAVHGEPRFAEYWMQQGWIHAATGALEQLRQGEPLHIPDVIVGDSRHYSEQYDRLIELSGARSLLMVPMRKDNALLGGITAFRQEVRPFAEREIALLQNFAAQAVIAMENARLITETREALEQQTATAEVLQVINSSPGNLVPVFEAMLEKAHALCGAPLGSLVLCDGEQLRAVATRGYPQEYDALARQGFSLTPSFRRLMSGEPFVHAPDPATHALDEDHPIRRAAVEIAGIRTVLFVPLRKDATVLGYISAQRQEVRPFTDKQIALLQNFAAQAVIAMENARLLTETREALEQQTATAEVLQVINSSPGDLPPVFDAMLDKAIRLCEATHGHLFTYDGKRFHLSAVRSGARYIEWARQAGPVQPYPSTPLGRLIRGERIVNVADIREDEGYRAVPMFRESVELRGVRSQIAVALLKDNVLLGAMNVYRQEVRPFSDKQVALLENFAAQAVIAMENARLITETREALEQQTATAEVLQVINGSPSDLAPVFSAILEKAHGLCGITFGTLQLYDGEKLRAVATRGFPEPLEKIIREPYAPEPNSPLLGLINGGRFVQIRDLAQHDTQIPNPRSRIAVDLDIRTLLFLPLRKDNLLLGLISAARTEEKLFSEREIALLENFATQAVIAMENARLITELRQRTRDLQESLEYQTATSDVLKVISQSTFDLRPVLQTVLDTAIRLCGNTQGLIFRREEDGVYQLAVSSGAEPEYLAREAGQAIRPGPDTLVGRTVLAGRPVQIIDAMSDPGYALKEEARVGQLRTMLGVPLLREGVPIGVICTARTTVEPFTEKQIALVTTFADQAVIAIENARLFNELRERTAELGRSVEELKMLSEVGRAVSSTLDLRAVLSTILTASLGMTWATAGAIFRYIRAERAFRLVETVGWDEALLGSVSDLSIAETETLMSEAALQRTPIQLTDLAELPSTRLRDASLAAGLRSVLIVPLVGPERIFGALVLQRREAGEFPAETVRLMQTLASQSVLAIQNARLFREIADKSEQLALASEHKSQFLANMSHELRTPLNAILGYAELLVDGIYGVLPEKAQGVLERVQNNGKHLLALINDVLDLAKIEAGQLALTLEDYSLAEVVRGVVTATEPLAAAKGLKFTANVQDGMPMAHGDARRVSQVLLNLAGNAIKFTDAGEVEINASAANGQFVLTVRDTGPGIADADQERIFGEFQQIENNDTRKKGGTGLGLAISKRMVEMQGGMISVDSTLGRGSTFRVVLPVQVEPAMEEAAE